MTKNEKHKDDEDYSFTNSIVSHFDELCFQREDEDCIQVIHPPPTDASADETPAATSTTSSLIMYLEIQEYSKALASQLYYRYRPQYVLIDCHGWPGAEIVAMLACMRLQIPFVPVSCHNQHAGRGRLAKIVQQLQKMQQPKEIISVAAVTCCENDQDPVLGVFQNANVHSILFLSPDGNPREALNVPSISALPPNLNSNNINKNDNDNLYILFTSGTSGNHPKAVIGSHKATWKRLQWRPTSQQKHSSPERVALRTPLTFVDAIAERLGTLLEPESLLVALAPSSVKSMTMDIDTIIAQTKCTQITMLPSQLTQWLVLFEGNNCNSDTDNVAQHRHHVKRIIISGEPCSESLWKTFHSIFYDSTKQTYSCELINLYGQTETTGDCCGAVLTNLDKDKVVVNHVVTIGTPLREEIQICHPSSSSSSSLAPEAEPQQEKSDSLGVPVHSSTTTSTSRDSRELVVSGNDCLANGYLGDILPSENGFRTLGNNNNIVAFATGDVGFCRDGLWYVQGRKDDVVKIHGVWTSPSEVETAFGEYYQERNHEGNTLAVAVSAAIIDQRVYVLVEDKGTSFCDEFSREHMKENTELPWNLIPYQVFGYNSDLPRTASTGKVDRARIKQIIQELIGQRKQQQSTLSSENGKNNDSTTRSIEEDKMGYSLKDFQSIVAAVLWLDLHLMVDLSKSFVELGGDSASAVSLLYQMRMQLNKRLVGHDAGENITAIDILNAGSLMDLWECLCGDGSIGGSSPPHKKKIRLQTGTNESKSSPTTFQPRPVSRWDDAHTSAAFAACVDATPVQRTFCKPSDTRNKHDDRCIFAACQSGVVQKISTAARGSSSAPSSNVPQTEQHKMCNDRPDFFRVDASYHLEGQRISSEPIIFSSQEDDVHESIILFGNPSPSTRTKKSCGAVVVSLPCTDLHEHHWRYEFSPGNTIQSLVLCQDCLWILVSSERKSNDLEDESSYNGVGSTQNHYVLLLDPKDGKKINMASEDLFSIQVPNKAISKPLILDGIEHGSTVSHDNVSSGGIVEDTSDERSSAILVYASSDWESGLFLVDTRLRKVISTATKTDINGNFGGELLFADKIGPVYKDLVACDETGDGCSFLVADSWGSLHQVKLGSEMSCLSIKLSNYALSSPEILDPTQQSSPRKRIVVGSYDGRVRCVDADLTAVLWECNVHAVVYTKPLALSDNHSLIVCTTAGDAVQIRSDNGERLWRYRIAVGAEIWSNPIEIEKTTTSSPDCDLVVAFGARDSRLHFITVKAVCHQSGS